MTCRISSVRCTACALVMPSFVRTLCVLHMRTLCVQARKHLPSFPLCHHRLRLFRRAWRARPLPPHLPCLPRPTQPLPRRGAYILKLLPELPHRRLSPRHLHPTPWCLHTCLLRKTTTALPPPPSRRQTSSPSPLTSPLKHHQRPNQPLSNPKTLQALQEKAEASLVVMARQMPHRQSCQRQHHPTKILHHRSRPSQS